MRREVVVDAVGAKVKRQNARMSAALNSRPPHAKVLADLLQFIQLGSRKYIYVL